MRNVILARTHSQFFIDGSDVETDFIEVKILIEGFDLGSP